MAQAPPLRRRDRGGHLDEDYMANNPYGYYDEPRRDSPRHRDDDRDRARRSRRPASPQMYNPEPRYESPPRRGKSLRDPPPRYAAESPPRRRNHSPPSGAYGADRRRGGGVPSARQTFPVDDYGRSERDPYGYGGGGRGGGRYDDEPRGGGRRSRYASPSPDRSRRAPGRDRPPPAYADASPPRRHRSSAGRTGGYGGAAPRGMSPPPARSSRPPPATAGRPPADGGRGGRPRRNSMPTVGGAGAGAAKAAKAGWWTNPMIQAAGRTALTAGAQAAMSSRKDTGPWIGPKGAKVAQAALMGGLMDGFMGGGKKEDDRRGRSGSMGGGGGGGGSGIKGDLMREGMAAALGKFASKR